MAENPQTPEEVKSAIFADNLMHAVLSNNNIEWQYIHPRSTLNQRYFNENTAGYLQTMMTSDKSTAFIRIVDIKSTREECVRAIETFKKNFQLQLSASTNSADIIALCQDIALFCVFIWLLNISGEKTALEFCNVKLQRTAYDRIAKIAKMALGFKKMLPVDDSVAIVGVADAANA